MEFSDPVTRSIADFLNEIGIVVIAADLDCETFLPGILVESGQLIVDEDKLKYPGDLLHEAGHLALAPAELRKALNGEVVFPGVNMAPIECQAIGWSYAAALHLGLDPRIVFHDGGYHGASKSMLETFSYGVYFGVSGLQDVGFTAFGDTAEALGVPPYPHMIKWTRD